VGLTILDHEHGREELLNAAALVDEPGIEVVLIEPPREAGETTTPNERTVHTKMEAMLAAGEIDAAVTLHYSFPIGMATIGRAQTPAQGRKAYIATTTGTSDTMRDAALLKNAIGAIAVAKACANTAPTLGILNLEGANTLLRNLRKLKDAGYDIIMAQSKRADGGELLRGNDLLNPAADIIITDSLTGNIAMKMLSAFTTGGSYEAVGDGYGPAVGENMDKIVCIISRASGAPVIAGAIKFAAQCARGNLVQRVKEEYAAARAAAQAAGLSVMFAATADRDLTLNKVRGEGEVSSSAPPATEAPPQQPPAKPTTCEIPGVEILDLDAAVHTLWRANIFAASGMGCTGPVVMVAEDDEAAARQALTAAGYL
jgi:hypothetical protein